jgi:hypothetical protein
MLESQNVKRAWMETHMPKTMSYQKGCYIFYTTALMLFVSLYTASQVGMLALIKAQKLIRYTN